MSIANPTLLRVGMSGLIDGRTHTVRCRAVLSVRIKSDVYFWNEYILDDGAGGMATLCYEEDDTGCVWRLFSDLSPLRSLSAREAAAKRVGDKVDLGRGPLRVTLVNRSRVVHIEGNPPDWLVVGDEADFLNAEANGRMLVVSWSGEEVEYYFGGTISARKVSETFGLPHLRERPRLALRDESESTTNWANWIVLAIGIAIAAAFAWSVSNDSTPRRRPDPAPKYPASEFTLPVAATGAMEPLGVFKIEGRATVEVGEPGVRFDRREYSIRSSEGQQRALLLDTVTSDAKGWMLLRPVPLPAAWTPAKLGSLRTGQPLEWGGIVLRVTKLQASRLLEQNGASHGSFRVGQLRYGLIAREGNEWLLVRWSETEALVYRGELLTERDVKQALRGPE